MSGVLVCRSNSGRVSLHLNDLHETFIDFARFRREVYFNMIQPVVDRFWKFIGVQTIDERYDQIPGQLIDLFAIFKSCFADFR